MRTIHRRLAMIVLVASLPGCRDVFGPERMDETTITGRVHIAGVPLTEGWIEFAPYDGTVGNLCSAGIQPDGSFIARRVAVGAVRLHLAGPRPPATGDSLTDWYLFNTRRSYTTKIEIKSGVNPPFDLDLRREAIALDKVAKERERQAGSGDQSQ